MHKHNFYENFKILRQVEGKIICSFKLIVLVLVLLNPDWNLLIANYSITTYDTLILTTAYPYLVMTRRIGVIVVH